MKAPVARLLVAPVAAIFSLGPMADNMTGSDIRQQYLRGESATAIVQDALDRIAAKDDTYHAVIISGGESVMAEAARVEALAAGDRADQPLGGIPVLIKDNIEVRDWPTTAGSLALKDNLTGRDAALVTRLREAGAIIVGKTNLSEWANFRSENSISGWSGVGGQTRNAHDASRSPCGSSSGSAAAVALGYVPIAIGSETDGSIICPAAINGVVGFKPTHGLVSGAGIVPLAASQDIAGPIAINVDDAARTLAVMLDPAHPESARLSASLQQLEAAGDLAGIRIGVLADTQGFDARRDTILAAALDTLATLGADVIPGLKLTPYEGFNQDEYDVLLYEFSRQLDSYLTSLPGESGKLSLARLIEFNEQSDTELSLFDQSIFIRARDLELTEAAYQQKLAAIKQAARKDGLDRLLKEHALDAIVGISVGPAWTIDDINGDAFHGPSMTSMPAVGGHPHLTVPMGKIRHMPVGLSIVGPRFLDAEIAALAAKFERAHPQ